MKIALSIAIFVSHGAHQPRSGIIYVRLPVNDEGTCAEETLKPGLQGSLRHKKR